MIKRLVLAGFSGTGKSTTGEVVADRIGWRLIDTDAEIQRATGKSIPEIFQVEGDSGFRAYERTELLRALAQDDVIIATGGGAVIADDAWSSGVLGGEGTLVVTLDAAPEILHQRLTRARELHGDAVKRPLLDTVNSLQKITDMKASRAEAYSRAHVTIPVGDRSPGETSEDLVELINLGNRVPSVVELQLPNVTSQVRVGPGVRHLLPGVIRDQWPNARRVWIAADEHVPTQTREATAVLTAAGYDVRSTSIPSGESHKSLAGLSDLYNWLLEGGVQRQDVLIALGGGKVGDLAGFAAATVLRGIGLVQLPTTLLAMVDSSIGGKTAINHATGKNLIGAFYQPSQVLIDPEMLATLPERELTSGWAEVIKHGEIQRSTPDGGTGHLRDVLVHNQAALRRLDEPLISWVIRQNLTIKAAVVHEDEREGGLRAILNYGHTLGHAIEASGYRYLHGEAIAVGLVGAVRLAVELGRIDASEIERIERTLGGFGLPIRAEASIADVLARTGSDKKKTGGMQQWVLANQEGRVTIETEVAPAAVERAAAAILYER
jgi:shikimate kinase/3-dehydroquinate synthase